LGVETNLITDRIFTFFDQGAQLTSSEELRRAHTWSSSLTHLFALTDGNGTIDFSELVCGLSVLCKGTPEEKIKCASSSFLLSTAPRTLPRVLFA
jgi:Ca2+-binding EF-hand superfamily protein